MNRRKLPVAAILAALAGGAVLVAVFGLMDRGQPGYPIERTVRYGFTVENTESRPLETVRFRTYAPVERTPTQKLVGLEASHPYEAETDALGNRVLRFTLRDLPPNGQAIIRITAHLRLAEKPNRVPRLEEAEDLLSPSALAPAENSRIRKLAASLTGDDPAATVRAVQSWAVANVAYQGYLAEDRGALYALEEGTGDCTEAMSLVLALLRANDIPALGVAGFPTTRSQVLRPEDFHNWAMAWPGEAFREADPVNERLAPGLSGYIAFRLLDPVAGSGPGLSTQSFFHTEQGSVAIRMDG